MSIYLSACGWFHGKSVLSVKSSPAHKTLCSNLMLWSLYLLCIFDLILTLLKSDCCLAHNVANNGLMLKWTWRMIDMENKISTHFQGFLFRQWNLIKISSVAVISCGVSCTSDSSCSATSRPAVANSLLCSCGYVNSRWETACFPLILTMGPTVVL